MMLFFSLMPEDSPPPRRALPDGMILRLWQPARHGFPPRGSRSRDNVVWWLLTRIGAFATDEFTELTVWQSETLVHRLTVSSRWWRVPFMSADDLEVGNIWTLPAARGQKLTHCVIGEAHRLFAGRRWWWLTDANNAASIAIARRCGYRCVGSGHKTRRLGIALWGRYMLKSEP